MKSLLIFLAFLLGALIPQAHRLNFMLRYMIMAMVFHSMLQAEFSRKSFSFRQVAVFAANIFFGFAWYFAFHLGGNLTLAQAAFFTAITPTATAAAVVTGMLGGRIDFTINTFLLTNLGMALLFPVIVPPISGTPAPGLFLKVARDVFLLVVFPFMLACATRKFLPRFAELCKKYKQISFYIWVAAIFLIIAKAADHIYKKWAEMSHTILLEIALISLAVCVVNFAAGALIGGRKFRTECSQALGQKNTTLTIYLALLYADPIVALAPTFYVLWHNLWNALQLWHHDRQRQAGEKASADGK